MSVTPSSLPMKIFFHLLLSSLFWNKVTSICGDPLTEILKTLDCVEKKEVECASKGYSPTFKKFHNGIDTNTVIDTDGSYWSTAFALLDIYLDYNHKINIGPNQASIRYKETVVMTNGTSLGLPEAKTEHPYNATFYQYEHALVTVDDDCKMDLWDQYGDNEEQKAVDSAAFTILCDFGFLPIEVCKPEKGESIKEDL